MECLRCGNKDQTYFYLGHKGCYCRKCIKFSRVLIDEDLYPYEYDISEGANDYSFDYKLTSKQIEASKKCLNCLKYSDVLLFCCCGAGKTEIVVESIGYYLSKGLKVAYAIARREVVIELSERFKKIFKNANIISVYGGHHNKLSGDLIVCTTHQLYRYYKSFDLLILDEVDAFPLKGNETLMNICINSCKGRIIFSTATIDDYLKRILKRRNYKKVELFVRPSMAPLVIPKLIYLPEFLLIIVLLYLMHKVNKQCIIFVSSKKMCKLLYKLFRHLYSCTYVYADLDCRSENINAFRNKQYQFIFATSVLERGITIKDVSVIIYTRDSTFDEANIIQMLGRVGRNINNPYGEAYILSNHFDKNIKAAITYLKHCNSYL